jgi:tetratricopeptide (TPR) repeat protein
MLTAREKTEQLERIISSRTFGEAMKLCPFLRRLVNAEINNETLGEYSLGRELFEKPENWNTFEETAVRQALLNLRKRLAEYYSTEGARDLAIVEFPKRMGFTAIWSYSESSDAINRVQNAAHRVKERLPESLDLCASVIQDMEKCVADYPSHAPAYAVLAEALILATLCDVTYFPAQNSIPRAEKAIHRCLELDNSLWEAHIILGALHCCRFRWSEAEEAFVTALRLEPNKTQSHLWYIGYLFAVGRAKEAQTFAFSRYKAMPNDRFNPYVIALLRYATRETKEAYDDLARLSPSYPEILQDNEYLCQQRVLDNANWLVDLLMSCVALDMGYERAADLYAIRAMQSSRSSSFRGLNVVTCVRISKLHVRYVATAEEVFEKIKDDFDESSGELLSYALACMGMEKTEKAIELLGRLCKDGHPLMAWLHIWPLFDPLRDHESFKSLIKRMKLPS